MPAAMDAIAPADGKGGAAATADVAKAGGRPTLNNAGGVKESTDIVNSVDGEVLAVPGRDVGGLREKLSAYDCGLLSFEDACIENIANEMFDLKQMELAGKGDGYDCRRHESLVLATG